MLSMAKYHQSSEKYLDDRISQAISDINQNYEQYKPFMELYCAGKEAEIRTDITNLNNDEHKCPNCDRNLIARVSTVRKRVDKKNDRPEEN